MLVAQRLTAFPRLTARAVVVRQSIARCSPYRQAWAARSIYASAYRRAEVVDAPPKTSPKTKAKGTRAKKADGDKPAKVKATKKVAAAKTAKPKVKKEKAAPKPPAKPRSRVHLPKQVSSIWQLFLSRQIDARKAELPTGEKLSVTKLATEIAGEYRSLSSEERTKLESELETVKAEYKKDYAAALAALTPEQILAENRVRAAKRKTGSSRKHNLRDPNKPKSPPTAYLLFYQDRLGDSTWASETLAKLSSEDQAIPTKRLPHMSRSAAAEWRSLSADEKSHYEQQAGEARTAYQTALAKYKEPSA